MQTPLHILHLEDDPLDAELIRRKLEADGLLCEIERVDTESDFSLALERNDTDLVLADFSMPGYDGMEALNLVQSMRPGLPFILFSGVMGEEAAVMALKKGATDYVLKDRPSRLAPAIRRAIEEVQLLKERQSLSNQLTHAQKLEIFGELVGGIAHDFNNILTIIMANSGMLMNELKITDRLYRYASHIEYASEHAAALTRQLLVFSRGDIREATLIPLNDLVQKTGLLLHRLIPEPIQIRITTCKKSLQIKADQNDIAQILINLVLNARDAIQVEGWITISTGFLSHEESSKLNFEHAGGLCFLRVSDTGSGMNTAVQSRVFEPFFTTKPEGQGTGLGLSTCQRLVAAAGGKITIESEVGQGSTFTIYLPRILDEIPGGAHLESETPPANGHGTILLVEDNHMLRDIVAKRLSDLGYRVIQAANGLQGLDALADDKGPAPDLVITDMILPLLSGQEMARLLRLKNPHIKVLFTSGYSEKTILPHDLSGNGIEIIRKPFTINRLANKITEILPPTVAPISHH